MKSNNYTLIIIPDKEQQTRTYHVSKNILGIFLGGVGFLILACFIVLTFFYSDILEYLKIKEEHGKLISERIEILNLSNDLKKLKHMDELIRNSLGAELNITSPLTIVDSSLVIYDPPSMRFSRIQNIPSKAPLKGYVSQKSGEVGLFSLNEHRGIDIVAKEGEPFFAAGKGVVVFSGWTHEFGNMIILYHGDDYFTHYGHNKRNLKKQLDLVERGEVIGLVGSTGISSGPHLHFEIWHEFLPVDPLDFFPEYSQKDMTLLDE